MDVQSAYGKVPFGAAACAPPNAIVIAICGRIGDVIVELYKHGIDAIFPTNPDFYRLKMLRKMHLKILKELQEVLLYY